MASNRFLSESVYQAEDWHIDISEEVDGVELDVNGATYVGGLREGLGSLVQTFTFIKLDNTTTRVLLLGRDTSGLVAGRYNFTIRVQYSNGDNSVLVNGVLEVKQSYA